MEAIRNNWKTILGIAILILGLVLTVILTQRKQILKSRASVEPDSLLEVSSDGGEVTYSDKTFNVTSPERKIHLRFKRPTEQQ